jgi:hypothetical protein
MRSFMILAAVMCLSGCAVGEFLGAYQLPVDTPPLTGPFPPLAGSIDGAPDPLSDEEAAALLREIEALDP